MRSRAGRQAFSRFAVRAAMALAGLVALLAIAPTSVWAYQELQSFSQPESRGADGRVTVEASIIHVVACNGPGENGGQYYVYQYVNRPGFRAILPPNWANALGGRDFPTYAEAAAVACGQSVAGPTVAAGTYLGCYQDPNSPFDLDGHLETSAQNTPQRCIGVCQKLGFAYAGVQYGQSCLCGNSYGRFGASGNCNMACTGDPGQVCGGAYANSVYAVAPSATVPVGIPSGSAIRVLSGTYGANCGQPEGNVTAHLRSACEGRTTCQYTIDATVIGDPAYGCGKDYAATWSCGTGTPQTVRAGAEAGYGSIVELRC